MWVVLQFFIAVLFFYVLLYRFTRNTPAPIPTVQLALVFLLKIAAGCFYGWLFLTVYGGDDTWVTHADSLDEWNQMKIHPLNFFTYEINLQHYLHDMGWQKGIAYFRMKLEKALLNKPLGIFNFYSQGNYYINVIAFNFMSFWGSYWLYQVLATILPHVKKWTFLIVFLFPPAVFWLSGIRADGMLFFFFSLFVFQLYRLFRQHGRRGTHLLIALAWLGMLVVKASFALLLLIPTTCWWLVETRNWSLVRSFVGIHLLALLLFFTSSFIDGPLNLPAAVSRVQQEFFALDGKTRVNLPALKPTPLSYAENFPAALDNILLRPYPWQAKGILQYALVIQNIFLICLIVWAMVRSRPQLQEFTTEPIIWTLLFFSISFYLSIAYTVPFPGAVVRYRVIPETVLVWALGFMAGLGDTSHYKFSNVYKKLINDRKT